MLQSYSISFARLRSRYLTLTTLRVWLLNIELRYQDNANITPLLQSYLTAFLSHVLHAFSYTLSLDTGRVFGAMKSNVLIRDRSQRSFPP